ncbi:LacI family DNA-binding transcriptional regulator [Mycoplasmopsis agassizii]|uniref:LacI family transcriptional regulator n=1 Tax=Mycoplasmopsis agassizii TaxID=33922 RepID=A0A1W1WZ08_9BACT|nr:LacI family DNA-binding transcriptional regulator [Mycoplasmopsis agassizii]PAF55175.1 LacI family transcriptional regulator [Mycoplasmopsis agassizii]PAK21033.1 LacI family transcriptional regulator [Mycoplasmopsis agassizii]SMC16874.1 transcriptional regulator, LacI family [Mycoplasmopsis agassizii]
MKKIVYKDIADKAGVSISTVSRYFTNGYISDKNKKQISNTLDQTGYIKNLWTKKDVDVKNIYFISKSLNDNDLIKIINSIDDTTRINQNELIITAATNEAAEYVKEIKKILSRSPKAIILINPPRGEVLTRYLQNIKNIVQIVVFGLQIPNINSIYIDYKKLISESANKFIEETGDRNLALVTDYRQTPATIKEQLIGFTSFCKNLEAATCSIKYFDNRVNQSVKTVVNDLKSKKIRNVICTTHDVFQNMLVHNVDGYFHLSDIGYNTIHDYNNSYFLKQFIDYRYIWLQIEDIIIKNITNTNVIIKGELIKPSTKEVVW